MPDLTEHDPLTTVRGAFHEGLRWGALAAGGLAPILLVVFGFVAFARWMAL